MAVLVMHVTVEIQKVVVKELKTFIERTQN